jgi:hypothetical protein
MCALLVMLAKMHLAAPLVAEPSSLKVEIATEKL